MKFPMAAAAAALALLSFSGNVARADPIPYPTAGFINPVVYTFTATATGNVTAYYATTGDPGFDNDLSLLVNGVSTGIFGLNTLTSSIGQSLVLGSVVAGDVLTFVLRNNSLGDGISVVEAYSDPLLNGPYDQGVGTQHVYSTLYTATGPLRFGGIPLGVYVGFEDAPVPSLGFSDFNYDDLSFVVTNVSVAAPVATPLPATLPLFATILAGGGLIAWRRKRKTAKLAA